MMRAEDVMAAQPTRVCIVSREPFRSGHFVSALHARLDFEDALEIIIDRRLGGSSGAPDLKEDRRHQPQVDRALKTKGFAIVPVSIDEATALENDDDQDELERVHGSLGQQPRTRAMRRIRVWSGFALIMIVAFLIGDAITTNLVQVFTSPASSGPARPPEQAKETLAGAQLPPATEEPVSASTVVASTRPDSPRDADRLTPKPRENSGPSEVSEVS